MDEHPKNRSVCLAIVCTDVGAVKGGWEAAFGPLQPQQRAGQKPSAEAREAVPTVEALWDAPSHALPAPSLLVNASLEALLGGAA